jgi:hypothetical protein
MLCVVRLQKSGKVWISFRLSQTIQTEPVY